MLLIGLLNDQSMEGLIIEDYLGIRISNISLKQSLKKPLTVQGVNYNLSAFFSSLFPRHQEAIYCADTAEYFDIKLLFSLFFKENRGMFALSTVSVLLLRNLRRFDDCSGVLHDYNGCMTLS